MSGPGPKPARSPRGQTRTVGIDQILRWSRQVWARAGWLAQGWFFVAVATLVLNDHLLKQTWPGWFTGKLSDFAGLVVVGTLASVLLGARAGVVLAGIGFVARPLERPRLIVAPAFDDPAFLARCGQPPPDDQQTCQLADSDS